MQRSTAVILGPALQAVSGVSTHLNHLFRSELSAEFDLLHFQVGSEGRGVENAMQKFARFALSPFTFAAFCLRHRPDVVHLNTSLVLKSYWRDIAYLFVAKIFGCKVLYQVHGGALPEELFRGNSLLTSLLSRVLNAPDVVVLLAQIEYQAYRAFVPGVRLEVIANAIDTTALVKESLNLKASGPLHLVYVGRLAGNKGVFEAVASLAMLTREGRSMHLTIAGSGPEEAMLRARVVELDMLDHVHFAGPLFGEAKDALWRSAHVFTFPTYAREGLPYALLEAMAAGAVPVTTRVGGIPDVMTDGVHGILVEAMDPAGLAAALRRLDDDRVSLACMAEAGRARVLSDYTVARLANDFRRLYFSLMAGD
jgi:glycosyltransferase involved in cell wall biosynthesis